jgi:Pyruvate/2-oxoacid:ferredoxin oxidoreductase gamma subunit
MRLGSGAFAPRVPPGQADLVIGLERVEALRATLEMLRPGGAVLYYDVVYQPASVRMNEAREPSADDLAAAVADRDGRLERVFVEGLTDPRMQNVALLGRLGDRGLIEGVTLPHIEEALGNTLAEALLESNLAVLRGGAAAG